MVIKSLVIALHIVEVSSLLFSASVVAIDTDIRLGLHALGMVNFREDTDADVDTDADGVETLEPACADDSVLSSTS